MHSVLLKDEPAVRVTRARGHAPIGRGPGAPPSSDQLGLALPLPNLEPQTARGLALSRDNFSGLAPALPRAGQTQGGLATLFRLPAFDEKNNLVFLGCCQVILLYNPAHTQRDFRPKFSFAFPGASFK